MKIVQEKQNFELKSHKWCSDDIVEFAHWHEKIEIIQVLKNKCRYLVDGNNMVANEGDLIFLKEGAIHLHYKENDVCEYRLIHFPYSLFTEINRYPENIKVHITAQELMSIEGLQDNLNVIFKIMDDQGAVVSTEENPFFAYLVMAVYSELAKYFPEREDGAIDKKSKKEIYKIIKYINANFREDINIQTISDALFISRSRLTRNFRKYMGIGISEYMTSLRIENANRLLSEGYGVTEAAIDSGFQSIRTFNYNYREYMGKTPREYIQEIKVKTSKK